MKAKIKQTILDIIAEKRANGDVLPYAHSIVVACMEGIFRNLFTTEEVETLTLF